MRDFRWLSVGKIPPAFDLRKCGWRLVPARSAAGDSIAIACCSGIATLGWLRFLIVRRPEMLRQTVLLGVADSRERARLLRFGFGEVLGEQPELDELEARAARLAGQAGMLPRCRQVGELRLDLVARDGFAGEQPLRLHPREFALIWRLAETPGIAVGKQTLIREVWRLQHMPETNSLAVHVSRLREKLGAAGLAELVCTAPSGGYLLAAPGSDAKVLVPPPTPISSVFFHIPTGNSPVCQE